MIVARAFFPDEARPRSRGSRSTSRSRSTGRSSPASSAASRARRRPPACPSTCVISSSGGCHGRITGLSGVAPRVLASATTACSASRRRSAAAAAPTRPRSSPRSSRRSRTGWTSSTSRAAARRAIPTRDPMVQVVTNVVEGRRRARHLRRQRPRALRPRHRRLALDRPGRHQRRRDGEQPHLHERRSRCRLPTASARAVRPRAGSMPSGVERRRTSSSSTSARSPARTGVRSTASCAAHASRPVPRRPRRARHARRLLVRAEGRATPRQAGAVGMIIADDRAGDPTAVPFQPRRSRRHDLRSRRRADPPGGRGSGGRGRFRVTATSTSEVSTTWPGVPTSFSSAGPHGVRPQAEAGHLRAGRADHLVDDDRVRGRPVRHPRRDELLGAAHRRRGRAAPPAASVVDAAAR